MGVTAEQGSNPRRSAAFYFRQFDAPAMKKTNKKLMGALIRFPMAGGGWMTYSTDQLEQMPKKLLTALRKFLRTPPDAVKPAYPKTSPRRRTKYFADGSALVAIKGGGTLFVESQPQYEVVGLKAKTGKPRPRRVQPLALTESVK